MHKVIHIGKLALDMGSMSHAIGGSKSVQQREKYLQYVAYQFRVGAF